MVGWFFKSNGLYINNRLPLSPGWYISSYKIISRSKIIQYKVFFIPKVIFKPKCSYQNVHIIMVLQPYYRAIYNIIIFQKIYKKFKNFPISEYYCNRGLWLPSSLDLTDNQIDRICNLINKYIN